MNRHIETVVPDSEGLSRRIVQDRKILALFKVFHEMGPDPVISADTITEVSHSRVNVPRLHGVLSRVKVEPLTEQAAEKRRNHSKPPAFTDTSTPSTPRSRRWPCGSLPPSPS